MTASSYLDSILESDQFLGKMMDMAIKLLGAGVERGAFLINRQEAELVPNDFEIVFLRNISQTELAQKFHPSFELIASIIREQRPLILSDTSWLPEFAMQSDLPLEGIRSIVGIPVMLRGKLEGILYLETHQVSDVEQVGKTLECLMMHAELLFENAWLSGLQTKLDQEYERRLVERTAKLTQENGALKIQNAQLKQKNQKLQGGYRQLQKQMGIREELAIVKERSRLARELHDTVGHTLTLIIMLLNLSRKNCLAEVSRTEINLSNAIAIAQSGLQELRRTVRGEVRETPKSNLIEAIAGVIDNAKKSGVEIDFFVSGKEVLKENPAFFASHQLCNGIGRICQEAITNSVRHGQAKRVDIMLRLTVGKLSLFIIDDGKGCKNIDKGFGLTGMEGRVKELNGIIVLGSDGEKGFNIRIEIPIERGFS